MPTFQVITKQTDGTNLIPISDIATGTPDGTKFIRDDGTLATPSGGGNSFGTIAVAGQSDVVADASADTLTLVAGTNVTITTNAGTDSVTINAAAGSVTIGSAAIAFTDGDTARRTTIADASVTSSSKILLSVTRPTVTAEDDKGFLYTANVVSRGAGTFDVFTICTDMSGDDPVLNPPNETITLFYTVG